MALGTWPNVTSPVEQIGKMSRPGNWAGMLCMDREQRMRGNEKRVFFLKMLSFLSKLLKYALVVVFNLSKMHKKKQNKTKQNLPAS